jgi:hypothetical protein
MMPNRIYFDGEKLVMKDGTDLNTYLKSQFTKPYDVVILNKAYAERLEVEAMYALAA